MRATVFHLIFTVEHHFKRSTVISDGQAGYMSIKFDTAGGCKHLHLVFLPHVTVFFSLFLGQVWKLCSHNHSVFSVCSELLCMSSLFAPSAFAPQRHLLYPDAFLCLCCGSVYDCVYVCV